MSFGIARRFAAVLASTLTTAPVPWRSIAFITAWRVRTDREAQVVTDIMQSDICVRYRLLSVYSYSA